MNKLRKITMGLILGAMSIGIVGCSGAKQVAGAAEIASEKVEIEYWYGLGASLGENMEKLVEEFNNSQNQYIVKTAVQGDYSETGKKLQAAFAAKKVPQVVLLRSDLADTIAKKGMAYPFQSFIDADPSFNIDDLVGGFREQSIYEGEIVTLPAYGTTQVLYYNKVKLEEVGFTPEDLSTWQGLAEVAKKVAKTDANGRLTYSGWMPMWGSGNLIDAVFSAGGKMISEDGQRVLINDEIWIEVWEQFRKWIHEDKIMSIEHGGQGWESWYKTIDHVMQDRALGYTGSAGDQGDLDFTKLAAACQPGWGEHKGAAVASAIMYLIPQGNHSEAQLQGAYEFVKFLTSPENTAKWSMDTGYIAVRNSALEVDFFKEYIANNEQVKVILEQADQYSSVPFFDPTGGKIFDALSIACDKVEIENIDAKTALDEAAKVAQAALDKVNNP